MHKKITNALYVLNIVFQSFFDLVTPAALLFGVSWLLVRYLSLPEWIYAPAIIIGLLLGFVSMVKFIITAMGGLERLEGEQRNKEKEIISKTGDKLSRGGNEK